MKIIFEQDSKSVSMKDLQQKWGWLVGLGACLIAGGFLAIAYAYTATLISVEYLGFLFIALGIFEGFQAIQFKGWSNFFLHLFLSILYLIGGLITVFYPVPSAINITLLLAMFFIIGGILKIIISVTTMVPMRGWLIIQGLLNCLLGGLILYQWPVSGLWVLGLMLGINMVFSGARLVTLGFSLKNYRA